MKLNPEKLASLITPISWSLLSAVLLFVRFMESDQLQAGSILFTALVIILAIFSIYEYKSDKAHDDEKATKLSKKPIRPKADL